MVVNSVNYKTYNKIYQSMDAEHNYPNTNLVRLEKWFFNSKPGKVLDHGCGYGENSIFLANLGYDVIATEISTNLLKHVKKKINQKCKNKKKINLKIINENASTIDFKTSSLDYIVSLGVLEMLGDKNSAKFLIDEFYRCLKPNGKMIVSTLAMKNTFVKNSKKLSFERYHFKKYEKYKRKLSLEYKLYIPSSKKSFANLFPKNNNIDLEIGSWDNEYCEVEGKHLVALLKKNK